MESSENLKNQNSILPLAVLAMGFIMATLDVTVVNVAGVSIQSSFHLTVSNYIFSSFIFYNY